MMQGKANAFHGFFGKVWMATGVQLMARLITKDKDHPWKGLARSHSLWYQ